jgi:N-methylhydantoinase A
MSLDTDAARKAIGTLDALGLSVEEAALAVMTVANEHMVAAIKELTINEGVDPRDAAIAAGGGAAGRGIAAIARELGCTRVLIPRSAGALSAFGGQQADIVAEAGRSLMTDSATFAFADVAEALDEVDGALSAIGAGLERHGISGGSFEHFVEARYAHQVWDLEIPLESDRIGTDAELARLVDGFHRTHRRVFAVDEPGQTVETTYWKGRLVAAPAKPPLTGLAPAASVEPVQLGERLAHFPGGVSASTPVYEGGSLPAGHHVSGPALIVEPTTTVVVPPGTKLTVTELGDYLLEEE